ncbi:uncharacterized protein LOC122074046 isoform X1 [Macadamia integrifolia]|uniref:uncharacterized protein LOC122074046 isoform X1 n=2 Tax=Macadamia integrifolia TaxID=60698 RepID=UPI001C4FE411|nr:uncharacterized protein LOC122074046 isoform X1 [Macadamia integrifolia]
MQYSSETLIQIFLQNQNPEIEMPPLRHSSRIDTLELKGQIIRKLGHETAERYFVLLNRLLSLRLSKPEFDKLCIATIGRKNLYLHNRLIGAMVKNACIAKTPPSRESRIEGSLSFKIANGHQRSSVQTLSGDAFSPSPRNGKSSNHRDFKFRDRPSPLGPLGKIQSILSDESTLRTRGQQSATELFSLSGRPPAEVVSVEDGEEVEQMAASPSIQSRSPVRAPLGIPMNMGGARKSFGNGFLSTFYPETCLNSSELPDTRSLRNQLKRKMERESIGISLDCANLLNNGLDAFLKRLIKPCLELAGSRAGHEHIKQINGQIAPGLNGVWPDRIIQRPSRSISASLLDFRVAMELNPQLLGEEWPIKLERVCLHASEE